MKYYLAYCLFAGDRSVLQNLPYIEYLNNDDEIGKKIETSQDKDFKIISLCGKNGKFDASKYTFSYSQKVYDTLNIKCEFVKFMTQFFPKNTPALIYYRRGTSSYLNPRYYYKKNRKMIVKPNVGCAGYRISIIHSLKNIDPNLSNDLVVTEYIDHTKFYSGHFLVKSGQIYNHVYFCTDIKLGTLVKGRIENYISLKKLETSDETIFEKIFKKLNYSGIACANFTIVNGVIKIFEINPRIGGSLVNNALYLKEFVETIITNKF